MSRRTHARAEARKEQVYQLGAALRGLELNLGHNLPLAEWAALVLDAEEMRVLPLADRTSARKPPPEPTNVLTQAEKLAVLTDRWHKGFALYHPQDLRMEDARAEQARAVIRARSRLRQDGLAFEDDDPPAPLAPQDLHAEVLRQLAALAESRHPKILPLPTVLPLPRTACR